MTIRRISDPSACRIIFRQCTGGEADVILAIGTRLQDFTTGSWTVFAHDAQFISVNAARYDATKHRALAVVGDALETVKELAAGMESWKANAAWTNKGKAEFKSWNDLLDKHQKPTNDPVPTYAMWSAVW